MTTLCCSMRARGCQWALLSNTSLSQVLLRSAAAWKGAQIAHLDVPSEPWVAREVAWHSYMLRAMLTYDDFFKSHILNQAGREPGKGSSIWIYALPLFS